jgi:hypothetical protein
VNADYLSNELATKPNEDIGLTVPFRLGTTVPSLMPTIIPDEFESVIEPDGRQKPTTKTDAVAKRQCQNRVKLKFRTTLSQARASSTPALL